MGQNRKKLRKNSHLIIHFPTSKGVSKVSERVNAVERASKASTAEQVNEWAVRANERVAQYFNLYTWLFWPTVVKKKRRKRMRREMIVIFMVRDWVIAFSAQKASHFPHSSLAPGYRFILSNEIFVRHEFLPEINSSFAYCGFLFWNF